MVQRGEELEVRVFMDGSAFDHQPSNVSGGRQVTPALPMLGYQLHIGVSGGRIGSLELVDISIEEHEDFVFAEIGDDVYEAFNIGNGQMLGGLFGGSAVTTGKGYLATFTYRASTDAVGTFVIDVQDDGSDSSQTFLVGAEQTDKINVSSTVPAVITIARAEGSRSSGL